jgi:hypothetical protein
MFTRISQDEYITESGIRIFRKNGIGGLWYVSDPRTVVEYAFSYMEKAFDKAAKLEG